MLRDIEKVKNTEALVSDFAVQDNLKLINNILKGKRIKRLFDAGQCEVFVEFEDGTLGMIASMESETGEGFLSIMPPTDTSESARIWWKVFEENDQVEGARDEE